MNRSYARLCLQYLVPKLIRDGGIDLTSFSESALRDEEILRFGQRVRISIDEEADPHAMRPQTVEIDLTSGETVTQSVPHTLGSPESPLTQERRLAKVDHCLEFAAIDSERASQLKERLQDVWKLDDTSRLVALTSPATA